MVNGEVFTVKSEPSYEGKPKVLNDIILHEKVDDEFYIDDNDYEKFRYLKGSKSHSKVNADGFEYKYSEGSMGFPDPLEKPSRTIITPNLKAF